MDIGLEGSIEKVAFRTSVFYRHMKDYITIAATNLPKRLPLSPNTVFQYRNGDADFWGLEVDGSVALTRAISLTGGISYLHGEDEAQGEPAIGVSPLQLNAGLRIDDSRFFGELGLLTVAEQDRVASSRGEQPTSGYTTLDAMVGLRPISQVEIRAGVRNLADEAYANHLNAKNPFAGGARVPEPGRTFYGAISIGLTAR